MNINAFATGLFLSFWLAALCTAWTLGRVRRRLWQYESRVILKKHRLIVAEYNPPQGITPAEIAYLYDQTFGKEEILATLFDLEQRGRVSLSRASGTNNFTVSILSTDAKGLNEYEYDLLLQVAQLRDPRWSAISRELIDFSSSFELKLQNYLTIKGLLCQPDDMQIRYRLGWITSA